MRRRVRRTLVPLLAIVIPLVVVAAFVGIGYGAALIWSTEPPAPVEPAAPATREVATATLAPTTTPLSSATPLPTTAPPPRPTATPQPTGIPTIAPTETLRPTQPPEPIATASPAPTETPAAPSPTTYGEVASYRLNLRRGPGAEYQTERTLVQGDRLEILAQAPNGIWVRAIAPSGTEGWVNSEYVTVTEGAIEELPVVQPPAPG
jgi:hypothetical protein